MRSTLLLIVASLMMFGCSGNGQKKPSAHVYAGEGPTVTYTNRPETAGGKLNTR